MQPREPRLFLEDIDTAISNILEFTSGGSAELFESRLVQAAVIRQFEIIGEAVRHLPQELLSRAPDAPWRGAVGMRNLLIHGYFNVDPGIVWETIENDLLPLRAEVRRLLQELDADDT